MELIEAKELTPFQEIVKGYESRESYLSFSSFKAFCESPRNFMGYKLRQRKKTRAMFFGGAFDCLLTEPGEFKNRFIVADKPDLRYKENKAAWAEINARAAAEGKKIITSDEYRTADLMAEFAYQDGAIRWVLDQITHTQVPLKWEFAGWKWRGIADLVGDDIFADLKVINPLSRKKVKWRIRDDRLIWQGALYALSKKCHGKDFYIVAICNDPNGMVIRYENKALKAFRDEIEYYVSKFDQCVMFDQWNEGLSFWAPYRSKYDSVGQGIYDWNDL